MERAAVLAPGSRVETQDLPEEIEQSIPSPVHAGTIRKLDEVEREHILAVLSASAAIARRRRSSSESAPARSTGS